MKNNLENHKIENFIIKKYIIYIRKKINKYKKYKDIKDILNSRCVCDI